MSMRGMSVVRTVGVADDAGGGRRVWRAMREADVGCGWAMGSWGVRSVSQGIRRIPWLTGIRPMKKDSVEFSYVQAQRKSFHALFRTTHCFRGYYTIRTIFVNLTPEIFPLHNSQKP